MSNQHNGGWLGNEGCEYREGYDAGLKGLPSTPNTYAYTARHAYEHGFDQGREQRLSQQVTK